MELLGSGGKTRQTPKDFHLLYRELPLASEEGAALAWGQLESFDIAQTVLSLDADIVAAPPVERRVIATKGRSFITETGNARARANTRHFHGTDAVWSEKREEERTGA